MKITRIFRVLTLSLGLSACDEAGNSADAVDPCSEYTLRETVLVPSDYAPNQPVNLDLMGEIFPTDDTITPLTEELLYEA